MTDARRSALPRPAQPFEDRPRRSRRQRPCAFGSTAACLAAVLLTALYAPTVRAERPATHFGQPRAPWTLAFEENRGQVDDRVRYLARTGAGDVFVLRDRIVVEIPSEGGRLLRPPGRGVGPPAGTGDLATSVAVSLTVVGGDARSEPVGEDPRVTRVSRFRGSDPRRWVAGAPTFGRVRYAKIYPGVDLVLRGSGEHLEFDYVIASGADPGRIAIDVDGAASLRLARDGDAVLALPGGGELRLRAPLAYQEHGGGRHVVGCAWRLAPAAHLGFELEAFRRDLPVVIDPVVMYSTFLGGMLADSFHRVAVDSLGNPVAVGTTYSPDFPVFTGVNMVRRNSDILVAKLSADGAKILFTATLGGADLDEGNALTLDHADNIVIGGYSTFNDYPVVRPLQEFPGGMSDAVVTVLDRAGTSISFSTYLGGWMEDQADSVAVDARGRIIAGGTTLSRNFPVTPGAYQTEWRGWDGHGFRWGDAFVAAIDPAGPTLVFSTLLGGWDDDRTLVVLADDGRDEVIAVGASHSDDFPLRDPIQWWRAGSFDITIVRLSANGGEMRFGSYLGSASDDFATAALMSGGELWLAGGTESANDFPTTPDALQREHAGGNSEGFLAGIGLDPPGLRYATYVGGSGSDGIGGIAIDPEGAVWLAGATDSADFPVAGWPAAGPAGQLDAFVLRLALDEPPRLLFSMLLGGDEQDVAFGIATDRRGTAFVAGSTISRDFPVKLPLQAAWRGVPGSGASDAFIARISPVGYPRPPRIPLRPAVP